MSLIHYIKRTENMLSVTVTCSALLRMRARIQCESRKIPPRDLTFCSFFHKRLRIFNRFFTHLLLVRIYTRPQIFIQLSPTLTKLCHIKRYYPVHINMLKMSKTGQTRAFRRLCKLLIALLIIVCGKSL